MCQEKKLNNIQYYDNNDKNLLHPMKAVNWPIINKRFKLIKLTNKREKRNYIIINTKVSQEKFLNNQLKDLYNNNKKRLFDLLNSYKNLYVVLTGEKKMSKCVEYDVHRYFVIYDDLISNINNCIDLTKDTTEDLYDYDLIIKNLNIIENSIFNISIGFGGQATIYTLLNDSILLSRRCSVLDSYLSLTNINDLYYNIWTDNFDIFLQQIKDKLDKSDKLDRSDPTPFNIFEM